jgi:hypothetical protein|tara:strand:- start:41 stop:1234 length:1194 start_codon:yes stop_codon:yes gene_type:complete
MANSWGGGTTTWGQGDWGDQTTTTVFLSGLSITASLDDVLSFPEQGWGRDAWGDENWGDSNLTLDLTGFSITASLGDLAYAAATDGWGRQGWGDDDWGTDTLTFIPTGLSITGSLGTPVAASEQGWGRSTWGNEPWGDSNSPTIILTESLLATASLGTLAYAQSIEGWGRDEWGIGNWGENTTTVIPDSFEITAGLGPDGWGQAPWDEMVAWGGDLRFETTQLTIASPTGIEITASLGSATISRLDMIFDLTTSFQMSAGLGVPSINNGADHSQGMSSFLGTMSLGTPTIGVTALPSGFEATMSLGTATATNTELVNVTGIQGSLSIGSLTIDDMAVGLSGIAITGSLGSLTITDTTIGLTGLEMSSTLGSGGVAPLYYKDVDITGNTSYTYVEHTA